MTDMKHIGRTRIGKILDWLHRAIHGPEPTLSDRTDYYRQAREAQRERARDERKRRADQWAAEYKADHYRQAQQQTNDSIWLDEAETELDPNAIPAFLKKQAD